MAILPQAFSTSKSWRSFSLFERCSTAMPWAGRTWMQQGMLVFTEAFMSFQLLVLRAYAFQKFFFHIVYS